MKNVYENNVKFFKYQKLVIIFTQSTLIKANVTQSNTLWLIFNSILKKQFSKLQLFQVILNSMIDILYFVWSP